MSDPLEIVCEVYGADVDTATRKRIEAALEAAAADIFDKPLRGLWVHEGVFGPRHPRNVVCPRCDSPPGVPCRNLRIRSGFATLKRGVYHPERYDAAKSMRNV